MSVTATLLIDFNPGTGGDATGHLSAEVDSRPDGLNAGKTSFAPGDDVYFFIYASSNVTYDPPVVSAGSVTDVNDSVITREDDVAFANVDTASLPVPAQAVTTHKWLGKALGDLTLRDEMTLQADTAGVAVARVAYTAAPDTWKLSSPTSVNGETDFSILVYIAGTVTG